MLIEVSFSFFTHSTISFQVGLYQHLVSLSFLLLNKSFFLLIFFFLSFLFSLRGRKIWKLFFSFSFLNHCPGPFAPERAFSGWLLSPREAVFTLCSSQLFSPPHLLCPSFSGNKVNKSSSCPICTAFGLGGIVLGFSHLLNSPVRNTDKWIPGSG